MLFFWIISSALLHCPISDLLFQSARRVAREAANKNRSDRRFHNETSSTVWCSTEVYETEKRSLLLEAWEDLQRGENKFIRINRDLRSPSSRPVLRLFFHISLQFQFLIFSLCVDIYFRLRFRANIAQEINLGSKQWLHNYLKESFAITFQSELDRESPELYAHPRISLCDLLHLHLL